MAEVQLPAFVRVGDQEIKVADVVVVPGVSSTGWWDVSGLTLVRATVPEPAPPPAP